MEEFEENFNLRVQKAHVNAIENRRQLVERKRDFIKWWKDEAKEYKIKTKLKMEDLLAMDVIKDRRLYNEASRTKESVGSRGVNV